jgi:hypothetical protein
MRVKSVSRSVIILSICLSVWLLLFLVECLYLNGSSYHGNISVTASGIPCQSWTEQCPHRHSMNNTYPELNNAENYCRNPQNSGQRPWCFTTDRNKRWEYCDIPKCIPGIEQYCTVISLNVYNFYIGRRWRNRLMKRLWSQRSWVRFSLRARDAYVKRISQRSTESHGFSSGTSVSWP